MGGVVMEFNRGFRNHRLVFFVLLKVSRLSRCFVERRADVVLLGFTLRLRYETVPVYTRLKLALYTISFGSFSSSAIASLALLLMLWRANSLRGEVQHRERG
jgi:hypothetical protein